MTQEIPRVLQEQQALGRTYYDQIHDSVPDSITLLFKSQTIFDSKQIADNQILFWDDRQVAGTGTNSAYNTNQASTTLSVTANTAGHRVRQTRRWFNYQPGKSQFAIMTGVMSGNATKRVGQFNDRNGLFFQHDTQFSVGIRTYTTGTAVDRIIPQSDWNIDKMNGTGNSGVTLDHTKTNIYFIDYEWLGVGTIRFGVFIGGVPYYVHADHNSNINDVVYMSTPNLPIRYEVINNGTQDESTITHICTTVITEGGRGNTGLERGISRGLNPLTTLNDDGIYPLFVSRLKSTHLGAFIRFIDFSTICTTASEYYIFLIINGTFVGTQPTYISLENSAIEYAIPGNDTKIEGGTTLFTQVGSDSNQSRTGINRAVESDLVIGSSIDRTPDTIALAVQRITGTTETFYGTLNFSETT
jgi:hypothetical protein